MGIPVVVVAAGGLPITVVTSGYGTPMTVATNGYGTAVTVVASGGLPVVDVDGSIGGGVDPDVPAAPVLTWDTDATDNTPTFTAIFDDDMIWAAGDIDGSNYDEITLQWDTDSGFGSVDSDDNTVDAAELLAGEVQFTTGSLAAGTWYARCRHNHVVASVDHISTWSNTVSQTLAGGGGTPVGARITSTGNYRIVSTGNYRKVA